MRRTNKIIMAVLLIAILLVGVGYAAIQNITLNISGTATADPSQANFTVRFSEETEVSDSSKVTAAVTDDTNATINVSGLTQAGESVTATYTIQNTSEDLSADLSVETSNSNTEYFVLDAELGKTSLTSGDATTLTVTVELIKTPISGTETSTIGIQLTAVPVQPGEEGTSGEINGGTTGDNTQIAYWTQNGTTVTNGTMTLNIGDTVDYVSGAMVGTGEYEWEDIYDEETGELVDQREVEITKKYETEMGGTWKVLGAENGQILLMSTINTKGENCGEGEYATGSRSIKVEDINRITGYNPRNVGVYDLSQTGEGTRYAQGLLKEYGNEVIYTAVWDEEFGDTVVQYTTSNGLNGDSKEGGCPYGQMNIPNGQIFDYDNPMTITNDGYEYYPNTLTIENTGDTVGLSTESQAYKMLFKNEEDSSNAMYELDTRSIMVLNNDGNYFYSNFYVHEGMVTSCIMQADGYCYGDYINYVDGADSCGTRSVVTLESDVVLTNNGTNSWTLSK